jgi:hypothetical protein
VVYWGFRSRDPAKTVALLGIPASLQMQLRLSPSGPGLH